MFDLEEARRLVAEVKRVQTELDALLPPATRPLGPDHDGGRPLDSAQAQRAADLVAELGDLQARLVRALRP